MGHLDRFALTVTCLVILFVAAGLFNALAPGYGTGIYLAIGGVVGIIVAAITVGMNAHQK